MRAMRSHFERHKGKWFLASSVVALHWALAAAYVRETRGVVTVQRPHLTCGGGGGNNSPSITVPDTQSVAWDRTKNFTGTTAIQITDADSDPQAVTIAVEHGTFTLSGTTGLGFTIGDGTDDAVMTFTGALADINAAMASIIYTPTATYAGSITTSTAGSPPDVLAITTDDGMTGTDGKAVFLNVVSGGDVLRVPLDIGTVFTDTTGMTAAGTGDPIGRASDGSGENNHATQGTSGARATVSADVPSAFSGDTNARSAEFDGTDDFLLTGANIDISGDAEFTLAGWAYFDDAGSAGICGSGNPLSSLEAVGFFYGLRGTNILSVEFAGGAPAYSDTTVSTGAWHHIAVTKTPGAINTTTKIYVDGSLLTLNAGSSTGTPNITNSPFALGRWTSLDSDYFDGKLKSWIVLPDSLSDTQIQYLSNGGQ